LVYDSGNNLVVVWSDQAGNDGDGGGIYARRFNAGGAPLGNDFLVNSTTVGSQGGAHLAADASGNFLVTWIGPDASDNGIHARRFASGGAPVGLEFGVNGFTPGFQSVPAVSYDPAGNFVFAWLTRDQYGDGDAVGSRRYDATGTPVGPEYVVNTTAAGYESFPSVAHLAGNDWVTVWHGGDNGNTIFAQRFTPGVPTDECAPTPQPCRTPAIPQKASIKIKNVSDDRKDALVWKWSAGSATTKLEFGDPVATDGYRLCVYAGGTLRGRGAAPAGGLCAGKACWKDGTKGFQYKDKDLTPSGVAGLKLQEGLDGKAKIQLNGRGADLSVAPPATLTSPVVVQVVNETSGLCWSAQYSSPAKKQTAEAFLDKAD
jgi:hypothetical protein